MHLAAELLRDHLTENKITQSDFARACRVDQSLVSQLIDGKIAISARNLSKLLAGLDSSDARLRFLVAYLHDQIPTEHVHELVIQPAKRAGATHVYGIDPSKVFDNAILQVVTQLPTQTKSEVYQLIQALRADAALRSVFHGVMRYVPRPLWPAASTEEPTAAPRTALNGAARLREAKRLASEKKKKDQLHARRVKRRLDRLTRGERAK